MKYKSFKKYITEKSTQAAAKQFDALGYKFEKQGGAKLKQKCAQFKAGSDAHTSCMYGQDKDEPKTEGFVAEQNQRPTAARRKASRTPEQQAQIDAIMSGGVGGGMTKTSDGKITIDKEKEKKQQDKFMKQSAEVAGGWGGGQFNKDTGAIEFGGIPGLRGLGLSGKYASVDAKGTNKTHYGNIALDATYAIPGAGLVTGMGLGLAKGAARGVARFGGNLGGKALTKGGNVVRQNVTRGRIPPGTDAGIGKRALSKLDTAVDKLGQGMRRRGARMSGRSLTRSRIASQTPRTTRAIDVAKTGLRGAAVTTGAAVSGGAAAVRGGAAAVRGGAAAVRGGSNLVRGGGGLAARGGGGAAVRGGGAAIRGGGGTVVRETGKRGLLKTGLGVGTGLVAFDALTNDGKGTQSLVDKGKETLGISKDQTLGDAAVDAVMGTGANQDKGTATPVTPAAAAGTTVSTGGKMSTSDRRAARDAIMSDPNHPAMKQAQKEIDRIAKRNMSRKSYKGNLGGSQEGINDVTRNRILSRYANQAVAKGAAAGGAAAGGSSTPQKEGSADGNRTGLTNAMATGVASAVQGDDAGMADAGDRITKGLRDPDGASVLGVPVPSVVSNFADRMSSKIGYGRLGGILPGTPLSDEDQKALEFQRLSPDQIRQVDPNAPKIDTNATPSAISNKEIPSGAGGGSTTRTTASGMAASPGTQTGQGTPAPQLNDFQNLSPEERIKQVNNYMRDNPGSSMSDALRNLNPRFSQRQGGVAQGTPPGPTIPMQQ